MARPEIKIHLNEQKPSYFPGDMISGEYEISGVGSEEIKAIELSILWYTEGRGDEDLGVHQFWRFCRETGDWIEPSQPSPSWLRPCRSLSAR